MKLLTVSLLLMMLVGCAGVNASPDHDVSLLRAVATDVLFLNGKP